MIKYCPNCKAELKPCGGVRRCPVCEGKYYILETQDPKSKEFAGPRCYNCEHERTCTIMKDKEACIINKT